MLSNGPVSYLKLVERNELNALRSELLTRVVLPVAGAPPGFDVNVVNGRVSSCFSKAPNANSLFLTIGPPAHVPVTCVVNVPGLTVSPAASVPTYDSLRVRRYTEAVMLLVPLRVTVLMPAPVKLPWRTSYGATLTCTCSIASSEIGATPVRSPMPPVVTPRPNELLKYDPSTVMLLERLSWPANEPLPPYCGVNRVMSVIRPEMVGSTANSSRLTAVAAPVRPELNTGSLWPTTVIVSETLATLSPNVRSCVTPKLTLTLFFTSEVKPVSDAVTV